MTRTEKTYYLVFGLYNASWSFLAAVYALFLLDRGLDLFQINLVLAAYFIGSFLCEVPTGAVADVFGRKISFLLSCLVRAAGFALYYFADSLPMFIVAELIDAVGTTLATGALDAWAVDGMRAEGDHRRSDRFFARSRMLAYAAMIASGCAGAYLAQDDLALPWLAGTGSFLLTFAVALLCMRRDDPRARRESAAPAAARGWRHVAARARTSLRAQIGDGLKTVLHHRLLRGLCALTFALAFAQMPFLHYWQPHLLAKSGGETWVLGWVWALLCAAAFVGSALLQRFAGRVRRGPMLALCALGRALSVLLAAWSLRFAPSLGGVVLQATGMGVTEATLGAWVNQHVGAAQRATVLSVHAMSFTAGGSLGLIALGYLARRFGIPVVWSISAAVLLLCAVGFRALREDSHEDVATGAVDEAGAAADAAA